MVLSLDTRRANACAHAIRLAELLERPTVTEVPQRIYRAKLWVEWRPSDVISEAEHDYLVISLVQNLNVPTAPNQQMPKVQVLVVRPFTQGLGQASVSRLDLYGHYSVDEIVAFLTLDKLDPDELEWIDDTKYSNIVVVGKMINQHLG